MAQYIGNTDEGNYNFSTELTSSVFFEYVAEADIPQKCFDGDCKFFVYNGESNIPLEESNDFFIHNLKQGYYYKFLKN